MDDVTRRRFVTEHRREWEIHRSRLAPEVARDVRAWVAEGRLELRAARIDRVEARPESLRAAHRHRAAGCRAPAPRDGPGRVAGGEPAPRRDDGGGPRATGAARPRHRRPPVSTSGCATPRVRRRDRCSPSARSSAARSGRPSPSPRSASKPCASQSRSREAPEERSPAAAAFAARSARARPSRAHRRRPRAPTRRLATCAAAPRSATRCGVEFGLLCTGVHARSGYGALPSVRRRDLTQERVATRARRRTSRSRPTTRGGCARFRTGVHAMSGFGALSSVTRRISPRSGWPRERGAPGRAGTTAGPTAGRPADPPQRERRTCELHHPATSRTGYDPRRRAVPGKAARRAAPPTPRATRLEPTCRAIRPRSSSSTRAS